MFILRLQNLLTLIVKLLEITTKIIKKYNLKPVNQYSTDRLSNFIELEIP